MSTEELRAALTEAIGDPARVSTGESELDLHAADFSFHRPHRPDVVVRVQSTAEVTAVLALADEQRVPVTPFGAGTSLEGHVDPDGGGISLDLTRMDRMLAIAPADLTATVQPGVTRQRPRARRRRARAVLPRRPGRRRHARRNGRDERCGNDDSALREDARNVLALEAVLADGRVIRAGSAAPKTSAGYDLLGLLIGSEGTLAVITELTLRLHGIPEHAVVLRIAFPDVAAAARAAVAIVGAGVGVTRIELIDGWTCAAINAHQGTDLRPCPPSSSRRTGAEQSVASDLELVRAVAEEEGAEDVVAERDPTARARLWAARHFAAHAAAAAAPGKRPRATDVCVPLSQLAATVSLARAEVDRRGLVAGILGHAGDGNVHVALHVDPDDPAELAEADELVDVLVTDALARGGTCTGEHGIGLGKSAGARAGASRSPAADARDQGALRPARDHEPRQGPAARLRRGPRALTPGQRARRTRLCAPGRHAWTTTAATTTTPPATVAAVGRSW